MSTNRPSHRRLRTLERQLHPADAGRGPPAGSVATARGAAAQLAGRVTLHAERLTPALGARLDD